MPVNVYNNAPKRRAKWKQILEDVLHDFDEGKFTEGMQFYTLEQVCTKYDISDITGRRVFNELRARGLIASAGRRGTIVTGSAIATEVYMCLPNAYFAAGGSGLGQYHSYQQLSEGFTSGSYQRLFRIVPISLDFLFDHRDNFISRHVIVSAEALVDFTQQPSVLNQSLLHQLRDTFNPIIFDSFGGIEGLTQVGVNFYRGIYKMVQYLVERGHRRIGYYSCTVSDLWLQPRFKGYIDGLFATGLPFDPQLMLITEANEREVNFPALHAYMRQPHRPTAIVCAHDVRALYVMEYCRDHHIAVPDELAVAGFDNIPEAALTPIPLTTVDGMKAQIASKTLELLSKRRAGKLKEPVEVSIDPPLIVRASA